MRQPIQVVGSCAADQDLAENSSITEEKDPRAGHLTR